MTALQTEDLNSSKELPLYRNNVQNGGFLNEENRVHVGPQGIIRIESTFSLSVLDLMDDEDDEENLPVANRIQEPEEIIVDGEEAIVDGVVITPTTSKERKNYFKAIIVIPFIISLILIITIFEQEKSKKSEPQETSTSILTEPPSSPSSHSLSMSPSVVLDNLVKEILLPISGEDVLDDPTSPQHYAWKKTAFNLPRYGSKFLAREDQKIQIVSPERIIQRYALLVTLLSTSDNFFEVYSDLLDINKTYPEECDFLKCNEDGEVTLLLIRNERATYRGGGTLAKEIGFVTGLTHIIMTNNGLVGPIPTELGNLKNLHTLDLSHNLISGTVPTELGRLQSLQWMLLNSNKLNGNIPASMGRAMNLFYWDISYNRITGSVPFELGHLAHMEGFSLYHNELSGNIDFLCHSDASNVTTFLEEVNLGSFITKENLYTYNASLTISISCDDEEQLLECSCCRCD